MRLNLGCGPNPPDEWENVDVVDYGQTHVADARDGLPFVDGVFDLVQVHHVLHMLPVDDVRLVLGELARVTMPGGVIRISDRDPAAGMRAFNRGGDWLLDLIADDVEPDLLGKFTRWLTWHGTMRSLLDARDYGDDLLIIDGHWTVGIECEYGRSVHRVDTSLDSRPDESFYVEAIRR